jgi:uncharacterized protein YfiM (DUF2279 family)
MIPFKIINYNHMKRTALLLVLLANIATAQDTWNQQWLKQDKAAHMTASAFVSAASIELARDIKIGAHEAEIIGVAVSLGVGMSKEFLYDSNPSPYDLCANAIGCVAGVYLNRWLQKKTSKWAQKRHIPVNNDPNYARKNRRYSKNRGLALQDYQQVNTELKLSRRNERPIDIKPTRNENIMVGVTVHTLDN